MHFHFEISALVILFRFTFPHRNVIHNAVIRIPFKGEKLYISGELHTAPHQVLIIDLLSKQSVPFTPRMPSRVILLRFSLQFLTLSASSP